MTKRCKTGKTGRSGGYYTGTEPSPKHFGYCARNEYVGTVRKGGNGKDWIVRGGRWVPLKGKANPVARTGRGFTPIRAIHKKPKKRTTKKNHRRR